eukprot:8257175-Heterocapsa_arctica.AAC.1
MPPERLVLPCVCIYSVQLILRLRADPLMIQSVAGVTPADVPAVEFVFVLCEACRAKEWCSFHHLGESGLRPGASCQNVTQCSRVV